MIVKPGGATLKTADSADSVFVGHLVTNQPLTAAKCSSCHSYCAGHSRTRVTLWSLWASGPQHTKYGWEGKGSVSQGMLSSRKRLRGKDLSLRCLQCSWLRCWCLEGREGGIGGLQPCFPSSASEVASADSECWFLLGHHRPLFVFCIQLHIGPGERPRDLTLVMATVMGRYHEALQTSLP